MELESRGHVQAGQLTRHWRDGQTLFADYSGPVLSVRAIGESMIRFRIACDGEFAPPRSWNVTRPDDAWPPVDVAVTELDGGVELATLHLAVRLEADGARISIRDRESGRVILTDGPDGGPMLHKDGSARWGMSVPEPADHHYYGFGERTGLLDKRGRRFTCWNTDRYEEQSSETDELYVSVPFLLSLNGRGESFGLYLNNTWRSAMDLTAIEHGRLVLEVAGGELDIYLIDGPEPVAVVERFTELVGRMPLPPRWALGYHQARWSYESAAEVREIAREFRRRGIPADAIHLDIDSMDGFRVYTWDSERFPDPARLSDDLRADGFRLVRIVDVGVKHEPTGEYRVYNEGVARDCFIRTSRVPDAPLFLCWVWPGHCAFPDFARADVREWWGEQYRVELDAGISGFIDDMNEPAMHDKPYDDPGSFRTDPPLDLPQGSPDEPTTHGEVHNVYGMLEVQGTREGLHRLRPGERPFLMTRAGFAGVQRFAGVWTGDNRSTWEHLEMSLPQLLNLGLSGIPVAGADIGGFFGNCEPELFARWMQLGAFYPFARSNSAKGTSRQEPWAFGPEVEAVSRRAMEQRYRLIPYFETVLAEIARTGLPFLRPLFLHHPDDPATHRIHDQALVGRDLMIAPIVRPGQSARAAYLPAGIWYDTRTGQHICGPGNVLADAPLSSSIPLFARGGCVIPSGPARQWTGEGSVDTLTIDVYPDEDGNAEGSIYEDDGVSLAYERGESRITSFTFQTASGRLFVRSEGGFNSPVRSIRVRLQRPERERFVDVPAGRPVWETEV